MMLPKSKGGSRLPPLPAGGQAAGRLEQARRERGLAYYETPRAETAEKAEKAEKAAPRPKRKKASSKSG